MERSIVEAFVINFEINCAGGEGVSNRNFLVAKKCRRRANGKCCNDSDHRYACKNFFHDRERRLAFSYPSLHRLMKVGGGRRCTRVRYYWLVGGGVGLQRKFGLFLCCST